MVFKSVNHLYIEVTLYILSVHPYSNIADTCRLKMSQIDVFPGDVPRPDLGVLTQTESIHRLSSRLWSLETGRTRNPLLGPEKTCVSVEPLLENQNLQRWSIEKTHT